MGTTVDESLSSVFFELGAIGFNGWQYSTSVLFSDVISPTMIKYFTQGYSFEDASDIVRDNSLANQLKIRVPFKTLDINYFIDIQNPSLSEPFYLVAPCIDMEGNVYRTVKIGTQWWMAENLKTTKYNDGANISLITDGTEWRNLNTGAYDYYDHDISNKTAYGALYNWYAVNTVKLCPTGWHVPSIDDLSIMETYLIENGYGSNNTRTAIAKSLASNSGWVPADSITMVGNDQGSNNSSGFSALPGGWEGQLGGFTNIHNSGMWWLSTENSQNNPYYFALDYAITYLWKGVNSNTSINNKTSGHSIRCIKD